MSLFLRFAVGVSLFSILTSTSGDERAENSMLTMLATVKIAGSCGMLSQIAQFQKSTQMAGGDEFLMRFLNTEAARLGLTLDQYLNNCTKAQAAYQTYYEAAKSSP